MKQFLALFFLPVFALVTMSMLNSCNQLQKGTVFEKQFIPAHYEPRVTQTIIGKQVYSTTTLEYVNDQYVIVFGEVIDGDKITINYYASPHVYDQYKVGDWFDLKHLKD